MNTSTRAGAFAVLQKIGRSLMLPVSVLPVAGILLGVGSAHFPWLPEIVSNIMAQAGGVIFGNLALIFAVGVVLGLTGNDGVATLAAVVGYVVLLATMGVMAAMFGYKPTLVMGIQSIETGVFGGILVGGIAAWLFNKYYGFSCRHTSGFFAGNRFVPDRHGAGVHHCRRHPQRLVAADRRGDQSDSRCGRLRATRIWRSSVWRV